jgi:crotonobetainyl-CoA:carnitine CoA-transferase CaiB-like acyl-CoA transferase
VYTTADVAADPVLAARDFWVELPHPECTGARHAGIPWRLSGTPLTVRRAAPTVGQHTDEVLREVLGLTDSDIAGLRGEGVLR